MNNENTNLSLAQLLNQVTMQIFADRYNLYLQIKETDKNNKERVIKINCDRKKSEKKEHCPS